jgi:hypothetical protein
MTLSAVEGAVEDTERSRSMERSRSIERRFALLIFPQLSDKKSHFFLWEAGGFFYIVALILKTTNR